MKLLEYTQTYTQNTIQHVKENKTQTRKWHITQPCPPAEKQGHDILWLGNH